MDFIYKSSHNFCRANKYSMKLIYFKMNPMVGILDVDILIYKLSQNLQCLTFNKSHMHYILARRE